ncbi:MAG: hypothetical protein KKH04_20870 [Proteobacteria bacterium]|nr:hypothetical protein [Pseudomonadota bacterium]
MQRNYALAAGRLKRAGIDAVEVIASAGEPSGWKPPFFWPGKEPSIPTLCIF